jgi:pimeloyl-ACP methyl ester carboxylesterase
MMGGTAMDETNISIRSGMFSTALRTGGSGEPLLYLHGPQGLQGTETFLDQFTPAFTVYAPAHPGFETSTGLEHIDDIFDLVVYYNDLLDTLGLESANVVGHCLGGMFAAEFAALCPERVRKLVLVSSMGLWDDSNPVIDFFALKPSDLPGVLWNDPACAVAAAMHTVPESREAQLEAFVARMQHLATSGKFLWPIPDKGLKKRIHRIKAPTHIVWGAADRLTPLCYAHKFHHGISRSTLSILPNCGHLPMLEARESFCQTVRDFLHGAS